MSGNAAWKLCFAAVCTGFAVWHFDTSLVTAAQVGFACIWWGLFIHEVQRR